MKKFFIGVWCTLLMSVVLSCSGSKPEIETALDEEGLYILDFQPVGELPIGDNKTNEGRALNRRVEITILQ